MDFEYICIDSAGKELRGRLSASDHQEAKLRLKGMGFLILGLGEKVKKSERLYRIKKGIKDTDIYNLSREMSVLLNAGINLDRALEMLIPSSSNVELKEILQQVLRNIKEGKSLSKALEDTKRFNPLVNVMIKVGESTGDLKTAFDNISQYLNFQIRFKNEIRNTMAYPLFLIFASIAILIAIFKLIIPRFFSIFGQDTSSLPLVSRALYSISNIVNSTNVFIILAFIGILIISSRRLNYGIIFRNLYNYLFYLPLLRNLIINLELSRFTYAMYSMLKSGVEFIKALALSREVIQNTNMRGAIERTIPQIREGKGIADTFSYIGFIPPMTLEMLRVGENSGNLKEIFFELYSVFDERFKNSMKRIMVLLEPIVITVMGIVVGIIVISLILTVMSVSNISL